MQNKRVFISNYPFARESKMPLQILKKTGCEIIINPHSRKLKPHETASFAMDCDAIIAGTEDLTPLVNGSSRLKMISRIGIGLDSVPLDLCKHKGIVVTYTPDAVTAAVSELTIGLMIALTRHIVTADHEIRENQWTRFYGKRIEKSVIGLIGMGRVGTQVARLLSVFKPQEIIVNDIVDIKARVQELSRMGVNIREASKNEIFETADIISLHVPLTSQTRLMINDNVLSRMKKTTFLINTARGGLVDEKALYHALLEKNLAGSAIDVFHEEPYNGDLKFLQNVVLTQHMGSCSYDCRERMETEAAEEVVRFLSGEPFKCPVPPEEYAAQEE